MFKEMNDQSIDWSDQFEYENEQLDQEDNLVIPIDEMDEIRFGKDVIKSDTEFKIRDLSDYGCDFMGIVWIDTFAPDFEKLLDKSQIGVRANQQMQDSNVLEIAAMKASFLQGFYDSAEIPCVDQDGNPMNGRTRFGTVIQLAEEYNGISGCEFRYYPAAQYDVKDRSRANLIRIGQRTNVHKPATSVRMDDFVEGTLSAIHAGDVANTRHDIEYHLRLAGVGERWDITTPEGKGILTKLINNAHKRSKDINNLKEVLIREKGLWEKWCNDNGHTLQRNRVLVSVDSRDYAYRLFHEVIAPAIKINNTPIEIITYTNKKRAGEAKKFRSDFFEILNKCYEHAHLVSYSIINEQVSLPWKDIGGIPQIIDEHDIDGNKLVNPSKY